MISVSIRFMLNLKSSPELTLGKKTVAVELNDETTFGGFLAGMGRFFGPALADEIYDSSEQALNRMVRPIINGSMASGSDGMEVVLKDGDNILFIPLIVGG